MVTSVLGKDVNTGELVTLEQEELLHGLYVIGETGTGKTTLLVNLALQDIQNGSGVCFFDPDGDAINNILSRLPASREEDVIFLELSDVNYPFGLNLLTCSDPNNPVAVQEVVDRYMHVFKMLWHIGKDTPRLENTLRAS